MLLLCLVVFGVEGVLDGDVCRPVYRSGSLAVVLAGVRMYSYVCMYVLVRVQGTSTSLSYKDRLR